MKHLKIYHTEKTSRKGRTQNVRKWLSLAARTLALSLSLSLLLSPLSGCGQKTDPALDQLKASRTDFILNTVVSITLYGTEDDSVIQECFDLCRSYEDKLSRTKETSEIALINDRKSDTVSEDTAFLIKKGLDYSTLTDGALDITIGSVSSQWDFLAETPVVPAADALAEGIKHVNYQNLSLDGTAVTFTDPDTMLDLGAIAKGYIADQIKDYLLEKGYKSALINLGGNILSVGSKPSGKDYTIGIQKPFDNTGVPMITFSESDLSVVTSGVYERCFTDENGNFYHHILDSKTGYPVDNNLYSVSIISKKSVDGDCLSTACFALGMDKALELINGMDDVYAIFVTDELDVVYSDGLEKEFTDIKVTK